MAMALTPASGAPPAWLASPVIRISIRYPPVAPIVSLFAAPPSQLKHSFGDFSEPFANSRAPCKPISSCTVHKKVSGG